MPTIQIILNGVRVDSAEQAPKVNDSFQTIANALTPQDVIDLAALLKEKPGIVQKAKQLKHLI